MKDEYKLPDQCNIVVCTILAKLTFLENMKWQTILPILKFIIFVKLKKQNVLCAHEFSWCANKVVCTAHFVLWIWLLFQVPFLVKKYLCSKSEISNFSYLFHKKIILKEWISFEKLDKQNVVWAHEFSWFAKKVVCTTYIVLGFSGLSRKMMKWYVRLYCTNPAK